MTSCISAFGDKNNFLQLVVHDCDTAVLLVIPKDRGVGLDVGLADVSSLAQGETQFLYLQPQSNFRFSFPIFQWLLVNRRWVVCQECCSRHEVYECSRNLPDFMYKGNAHSSQFTVNAFIIKYENHCIEQTYDINIAYKAVVFNLAMAATQFSIIKCPAAQIKIYNA